MTAILLLAVSIAAALAYMAPAYTYEEPLRRRVRALQPATGQSIWEVSGVEPGLDLAEGAPAGWMPASGPLPENLPWTPMNAPFVFRTAAPSLGPPPATVSTFVLRPVAAGIELELAVLPTEPGVTVTFLMPPGTRPARASLPGVERSGHWRATFVAVPAEGIIFKASFPGDAAAALRRMQVLVASLGFPNGTGWQRLPAWLPQERTVWSGSAMWQLLPGEGAIAQVPPLR